MDELIYILKRVLWISQDLQDNDTYAEICDWVKRMENDITYGDQESDNYFIENLANKLRQK